MTQSLEPVPYEQFKVFDQETMIELIAGSDMRYAQKFMDTFSRIYVYILNNHERGQEILDQMYAEDDPNRAREMILPYVESRPDDYEGGLFSHNPFDATRDQG
jgi:hypothetical protein